MIYSVHVLTKTNHSKHILMHHIIQFGLNLFLCQPLSRSLPLCIDCRRFTSPRTTYMRQRHRYGVDGAIKNHYNFVKEFCQTGEKSLEINYQMSIRPSRRRWNTALLAAMAAAAATAIIIIFIITICTIKFFDGRRSPRNKKSIISLAKHTDTFADTIYHSHWTHTTCVRNVSFSRFHFSFAQNCRSRSREWWHFMK